MTCMTQRFDLDTGGILMLVKRLPFTPSFLYYIRDSNPTYSHLGSNGKKKKKMIQLKQFSKFKQLFTLILIMNKVSQYSSFTSVDTLRESYFVSELFSIDKNIFEYLILFVLVQKITRIRYTGHDALNVYNREYLDIVYILYTYSWSKISTPLSQGLCHRRRSS